MPKSNKTIDVKSLTPLERFAYWINERESIRLKKEAGEPRPWTNDKILDTYRFCNVVRIEDKVSQWLLSNWYKPYFDHHHIIAACAIARFFNKPESLAKITDLVFNRRFPSLPEIKVVLRNAKLKGPVFNGAYIVSGQGDGSDKIETVIIHIKRLEDRLMDKPTFHTMQEAWSYLCECTGFASFMAGQVVADLRWARSGTWVDKDDWAPMGPGSRRGINRLCNVSVKSPLIQSQFLEKLKSLKLTVAVKLPQLLTNRMEMMDWQNTLCEIDKYERALWDEGRPKQLYRG